MLDLGGARAANLEALTRLGARVRIAALDDYLSDALPDADPERFARRLVEALGPPPPRAQRSSLVLAWDLLDSWDPARIAAFASVIAERSRAGGAIFLFVAGGAEERRAPQRYRFTAEAEIQLEPPNESTPTRHVGASRHKPAEIERALGVFQVEGSWILRRGVHEYLFRRPLPIAPEALE